MFRRLASRLTPKFIRNLRHFFYAWWGAVKYHHPSRELLVIGVTGTSGKSTTIFLLRQLLEFSGYKVGSLSTIDFQIAGENKLNDQKMTMLGKMQIQKYLREMVDKGCQIAIIETTSEGRVQHRHRFIDYDIMALTNLYPEHIESHGSFEKYKKAKLDIFQSASKYGYGRKSADKLGFPTLKKESCDELVKTAIVNGDSEYAQEFLSAGVWQRRYTFGLNQKIYPETSNSFNAQSVSADKNGVSFLVDDYRFSPAMYGEHNVMNIMLVITVARLLGIDWPVIQKAVHTFTNAPGRIEFINESQKQGFQIIVDYAFEPKAIEALYDVVALLKPKRVIHVFGSTGGGRDVSRRFSVGQFVGKHADVCVITDEDPYDDDPQKIIDDVAGAVISAEKKEGSELYKIIDRRSAVSKAISIAKEGDIILVTGKGSEQAMCISGGKKIPWDDRTVVREEYFKIYGSAD